MRSEPFLAKLIRWAMWATPAVALIIFSQYMSPFHFGKVVVFRTLIQLLLACYLVLIWQDKSYRPRLDVIGWAFLAFALAFTVTTFTSVSPYHSFWGTIERMGGLFTFWHYFAFFVMLTAVMKERRDWYVLLNLTIVAGVFSAFYGFLQKTDWTFILGSGGRQRPFGTIGNAALFAGYQILGAFLATAFSLRAGQSSGRVWMYRIAAGLMFLAVFMTAVRGSLLGVVAGAFIVLLLYSSIYRARKTKFALLGLVAASALFFLFAQLFHESTFVKGSPYLTRITDFSSQTFTVKTRFWAWSAGLQGWTENPKTLLLGWGPENFNVPFSKYFNPRFFTGPGAETFFDRAHNMFMEVLVTMGLLGELAYLALFGAVFWSLAQLMKRDPSAGSGQGRDDRIVALVFAGMTVAYIIHNSFIFDTSANFITFFTLIGFVSFLRSEARPGDAKPPRKLQRPGGLGAGQVIVLSLLLVFAIILTVRTNIRTSQANFATTRAIIAGWQGEFLTAMTKYGESVAYDTFGVYEYRHRMAQYLLEVSANIGNQELPEPVVLALEFAISETEKNTLLNEYDYLPLLYIARMHIILGQNDPGSEHNDLALEYTDRALAISPTFVRTYYEVAQAYLNKKDFAKAYEWFAKAQQLNPEVGITYWYMGIVRAQLGDPQGAVELINEAAKFGHGLSQADFEKVVNIYLQLGDLEAVIGLLERLLEQAPDRADYWASLAAAHDQAGDGPSAIEAGEKATELDESYAPALQALKEKYGAQ
ncbi:MAG TPA: tetratricopeptide repeat protein [Candidatus Paceibacterota bacterium]|nr:tetratricopeptide repeat protein [Candidatus Paceibacterota bacterium]